MITAALAPPGLTPARICTNSADTFIAIAAPNDTGPATTDTNLTTRAGSETFRPGGSELDT